MRSTLLSKRVAPAAVGMILIAVQVSTQTPAAAAAAPLSELQRYSGSSSLQGSEPTKVAIALCPAGKVIVGGGGRVVEEGVVSHQLTLTQVEPSRSIPTTNGRHGYIVSAAETLAPGTTNRWHVEAWALCAKPVAGLAVYELQSTRADSISDTMRAIAVPCPPGQVVLGSGARITYPTSPGGQQVALQVARPSGIGDIARAQAHADPDGFDGSWRVTASAICAPKPLGYQVVFWPSMDPSTAVVKTATTTCPATLRAISAGAATSNIAPGNISLTEVNLLADRVVQVRATENFPTNQDWDFIVGSAVCATAT
jgi:hypothetical protein